MRPSFSWQRVFIATGISLFVQLVIAKVQLDDLRDELDQTKILLENANRPAPRYTSLSQQLRDMSDKDRDGHIQNLSAIADAICSKDQSR